MTRRSPPQEISLSATSMMSWTWDVEFRPQKKKYKAYGQFSWESSRWSSLGTLAIPFDVREACELLQTLGECGLSAGNLGKISVRGVEDWQADLLQMAAITEDNPCYGELEFLLTLSDADIQWVRSRVGALYAQPALSVVGNLAKFLKDCGDSAGTSNLDAILERLKIDRHASETEFRNSIDQYKATRLEARKERLKPFGPVIEQVVKTYGIRKPSNSFPKEANQLTRALKNFVLKHDRLPNTISVTNIGEVDVLTLRYETVEAFIAEQAPRNPIPSVKLKLCTRFDPPTDKSVLDRILYAWVKASRKPEAALFKSGWTTELGFLPWALGTEGKIALEHFGETHPKESEAIRQWLSKTAEEIDSEVADTRAQNFAHSAILSLMRGFVKWVRDVS